MSGFVYCWTNKKNGKKYIGSHIGLPSDGYTGSGKAFLRAIKKYGIESFTRELFEENLVDSLVRDREQYYLDLHGVYKNDKYYNIVQYSVGGFDHINDNPIFKHNNTERIRNMVKNNGHPKGFKDKHHTDEAWDKTRSGWKEWADKELKRPVQQFTKDGVFLREHESLTAAAKFVEGNASNIKYTIEGKHKWAYNSTWKYK